MLGRTKIRPVLQKLCIICIGWPMCFFLCRKWYIYVDLIFMYWLLRRFYSLCLNVFFMYILTLHCIFLAPIYSRILAFWLMLSVVKTTLNKFYLILSYLILSYLTAGLWGRRVRYWRAITGSRAMLVASVQPAHIIWRHCNAPTQSPG